MHLLEAVSTEWLILIVVAMLYLTDSVVMLGTRDALIYRASSGWAVTFGSRTFTLRGQPTCLLSVWTPHRPVFRLSLLETRRDIPRASVTEDTPTPTKDWDELCNAFGVLAFVPLAVAVGLFVLLPLGLFTPYGHRAVWAALVWIYGPAIVGVVLGWRNRKTFGLTRTNWVGLAFDVLACPPHALNLVRKLSLHASRDELPDTDLLRVATTLLADKAEIAFYQGLTVMVDDLMDIVNSDEELTRLGALRAAITQETSRGD